MTGKTVRNPRRRRAVRTSTSPQPRDDGGAEAPAETLDPAQTWTLTFDTSCGTFVVTLDLESAPATTASLVALAEDGFYDDTGSIASCPAS